MQTGARCWEVTRPVCDAKSLRWSWAQVPLPGGPTGACHGDAV